MKLAAISVDLDEIPHYERVYGLPEKHEASGLVYQVGIPRALAFAHSSAVPLTLFAVGSDTLRRENAARLGDAAALGHAVESHSMFHAYDLSFQTPSQICADVRDSLDAIEAAVGRRPVGFRAPGYLVSEALFDALEAQKLRFDASVLPSPWYFGAKIGVVAWRRLRGIRSASMARGLSQGLGPVIPYRPGRTQRSTGDRRFVELPMATLPGLRLPVLGTTLPWLPELALNSLTKSEFVSLELHGIDFLDQSDGLEHLREGPELRIPLDKRLSAFAAVVRLFRGAGFRFVHLAEAADYYATVV